MAKYVTFGEIMMRLKPPQKDRFIQTHNFEVVYGGSEANVAVELAGFFEDAAFVTALPNNPLGMSAMAAISKMGVTPLVTKKDGRLGLYFLESGADCRPSRVIYDRANSVFALNCDYDWQKLLMDAKYFHTSGVTIGVSQNAADCALLAVKSAHDMGKIVSIDLNYRAKLWKYLDSDAKSCDVTKQDKIHKIMGEVVKHCDILFANEGDIQNALGITINTFDKYQAASAGCHGEKVNDVDYYKDLCFKVAQLFPNLTTIAVTLRGSVSADDNSFSAVMLCREGNPCVTKNSDSFDYNFYTASKYIIRNIIERVGAGDAFCGGLLYALEHNACDKKSALEFAVACGALKHTITGDFNLVTLDEVTNLMKGDITGRIQR